jgi:hypothetical protein
MNSEARIAIATGWLKLNPRPEKEKLVNPTLPLIVNKFGLHPDEAIEAMKRARKFQRKPRILGHWNDVKSRQGDVWTEEQREALRERNRARNRDAANTNSTS